MKAKDKTTSKEQSIRIEGSSGLSEADIEKMRADADTNAEADKQKKELVETQNAADQVLYAAEKALKEHLPAMPAHAGQAGGEKVGDDIKKNVQEKIDGLKSARNGTDTIAIKSASEALSTAMSAIGQAMSNPPAGGQQQTPPVEPPKDDQKPPEEPPHL